MPVCSVLGRPNRRRRLCSFFGIFGIFGLLDLVLSFGVFGFKGMIIVGMFSILHSLRSVWNVNNYWKGWLQTRKSRDTMTYVLDCSWSLLKNWIPVNIKKNLLCFNFKNAQIIYICPNSFYKWAKEESRQNCHFFSRK